MNDNSLNLKKGDHRYNGLNSDKDKHKSGGLNELEYAASENILGMKQSEIHKYDDIIMLEHPTSKKHSHLTMDKRAAQFAPFAALTGYGEAVEEVDEIMLRENELGISQEIT